MRPKPEELLHCSFCQKAQDQVSKLISAPGNHSSVIICGECVEAAYQILDNDGLDQQSAVAKTTEIHVEAIPDSHLQCSFCQKTRMKVKKLIRPPSQFPRTYICGECVRVCIQILDDCARKEGHEIIRPRRVAQTPVEQVGERVSLIDQIASRIFRPH